MSEKALDQFTRSGGFKQTQQLKARMGELEKFVQLLLDAMDMANEIDDPSQFIHSCLELICRGTGHSIGIMWALDRASDRLVYRSHIDLHRIETVEFVQFCRTLSWQRSEHGLPVQVWTSGEPLWVPNVNGYIAFERQALAHAAGLKTAFAFPILDKEGVIGVFEFFGRKPEPVNEQALDILRRLGRYIGLVFERKDAERNLREIQAHQKLLQEQLQATADEATNSAKLKSEFVANVSHEIRTPLAGIMGMAELLATQDGIDEETRDVAGFILSSAHNLLAIVNDLLDFSKLEAGKLALYKEQFSVNDLILEVARSLGVTAEKKGLRVNVQLDPAMPAHVYGDRARLAQILLNFGHNAVKFTERGQIRISARLESLVGSVARISISVHDTGIGITEDAQDRLFEPFVQADGSTTRKYGGTGLGLSIAKNLASLMSGSIGVESESGKGSTFTVTVPLEIYEERIIG